MEKQFKLPKEFTERWLTALEGGEYVQGRALLYDGDREDYCCLGVACVIAGARPEELDGIELPENLDDIPQLLPQELVDGNDGLVDICTSLNDGRRSVKNPAGLHYSFPEIASWIRENVQLY